MPHTLVKAKLYLLWLNIIIIAHVFRRRKTMQLVFFVCWILVFLNFIFEGYQTHIIYIYILGSCLSYVEVYYDTPYCTGRIIVNNTVFFNTQACQSGTDFSCSNQSPPDSFLGNQAFVLRYCYSILFILNTIIIVRIYPIVYSNYPHLNLTTNCNGTVGAHALVLPNTCFYFPFIFGLNTFNGDTFYYGKATLNSATSKIIIPKYK